MRRLFGKAKETAPAATLDDAVSSLDRRGGAIDEKIKKLDEELQRHMELCRKARPGPAQEAAKQRALRVLKQKKLYESQRDTLYQQQFNVEQASFAMASVQDTKVQVQAMKAAAKDLKKQFKSPELNINAIDKLSDEMADLMGISAEIQESLGQNYAVPDGIDEDELLGELDALELDMAAEKESAPADAVPSYLLDTELPSAPTAAPGTAAPELPTAPLPQAPARA